MCDVAGGQCEPVNVRALLVSSGLGWLMTPGRGALWGCGGDAISSVFVLTLKKKQVHRAAAGGNGCLWPGLVGFYCYSPLVGGRVLTTRFCSAARDQLTGSPVAVKKIMKPFSTPVLSKRTYRELKLLKHLRHENVGGGLSCLCPGRTDEESRSSV